MSRPTRHLRTQIIRFRHAVPAALRAIVGKREWEVSLGTRESKETIEKATAALDQIAALHAMARARYAGELVRLSQRQIDALWAEWLRNAVQAHGDDPREGSDWSEYLGALAGQVP